MLTQDQLARLAAREAHEGDRVLVDPELVHIGRYLPPGASVVERCEPGAPADLAFISATRFLGGEGGHGALGQAEHLTHAHRKILVLLPTSPISIGELLGQAIHASNGHAVDRVIASFGVVDMTQEGMVLRQLAPSVSARDVQAKAQVELLAGPDLSEIEV